jgi:MFS transporter, FHS family, glucose/mannose:H+ symporter
MTERIKLASFTALTMLVLASVSTGLSASLLEIAASFEITPSKAGILYTLHFSGFMGFILLTLLIRGLRARLLLITVFAGVYVAALLTAGTTSMFVLLALALVCAGGAGGIIESHTTTLQVITAVNEAEAGRIVSVTQAFFALGALLAPVYLAAAQPLGGHQWRTLFLALSVIATLALLIGLLIKPERFQHPPSQNSSIRWRPVMRGCTAIGLYVGAEVVIFGWVPTVMQLYHGVPAARAKLAPTLFWMGILGGRLVTARLTDRFSATTLLRVLTLTGAAASVLLVLVSSEPLLWLAVGTAAISFSGIWPLIIATTGSSGHETVTTIAVAAGGLGASIFPYIAGRIAEFLPGPFILSMATPLMIVVFLLTRKAAE